MEPLWLGTGAFSHKQLFFFSTGFDYVAVSEAESDSFGELKVFSRSEFYLILGSETQSHSSASGIRGLSCLKLQELLRLTASKLSSFVWLACPGWPELTFCYRSRPEEGINRLICCLFTGDL